MAFFIQSDPWDQLPHITASGCFRGTPADLAVFLLAVDVDVDVEVMGWDATVDGVLLAALITNGAFLKRQKNSTKVANWDLVIMIVIMMVLLLFLRRILNEICHQRHPSIVIHRRHEAFLGGVASHVH